MGMTFAEKIFARKLGKETAVKNEICVVQPDFVLSHDNAAAISGTFKKIGLKNVKHPDRVVIILDHAVPAPTEKHAQNHKEIREFVKEQGIKNFYDAGCGICHQILPEEGFAKPGTFIVGSDSHTCTYGAFGGFSTGIGRSEVAAIWASGELWFKVPESMKIVVNGKFPKGVEAKDLILKIIGDIGADGALYRSVEFTGETIKNMTISERMTLCNMAIEMGGKNGYIAPDAKTFEWLGIKAEDADIILPDEDADYEEILTYNAEDLKPVISGPHSVDLIHEAKKMDLKIDQAFIGTCTNGRIEDLRIAAEILKGKKKAEDTRLLIVPASTKIYKQAIEEGLISIFIDAGAIVMNPNCGPCMGNHGGILAPGEICLSTANRNFKGRMGCKDAEIYLGSVATVATSAINGKMCDPRS